MTTIPNCTIFCKTEEESINLCALFVKNNIYWGTPYPEDTKEKIKSHWDLGGIHYTIYEVYRDDRRQSLSYGFGDEPGTISFKETLRFLDPTNTQKIDAYFETL